MGLTDVNIHASMYVMRRTAEEAAQTREDILAAALREFSQYGYHAANLGRIAKAAGVTEPAKYFEAEEKAKEVPMVSFD